MSQDAGVSRRAFLFGAAGSTAAAAGAAAAQENGSSGGNQTGGNASAGGNQTGNATGGNASAGGNQTGNASGGNNSSGGGGQTVTRNVAVGPGGNFTFEPSEVVITPGSTVVWQWESDNHNVVPQSQPEGANWQGEGSQGTTFNTGHTYEHTFDTNGTYEYVCTPHESQGMTGTVTVQDTLPTPEPAASQPTVPDSAKSLGVASAFALAATLGLSFFFLKYGGDFETPEE